MLSHSNINVKERGRVYESCHVGIRQLDQLAKSGAPHLARANCGK
jgi:hypothetical protein